MKGRVAGGVAVLILLASLAHALPFLDDPGVVYGLQIVSDLLKAIEQAELEAALTLQKGIRGVVADVGFPPSLFGELHETLSTVRGIRGEITSLSCAWNFSARTAFLRNLYLGFQSLCRREFEGVWGHPIGHDSDLEEWHAYLGTLSTNMVSGRVDRVEGWRGLLPAMQKDSALTRVSPGEASRDEAVALSATALIADSNSAIKSQSLLLEQVEIAAERREERRGVDMTRFILTNAAGLDPWANP
jgi:hypothetical protein